jgi:hypothetical protein
VVAETEFGHHTIPTGTNGTLSPNVTPTLKKKQPATSKKKVFSMILLITFLSKNNDIERYLKIILFLRNIGPLQNVPLKLKLLLKKFFLSTSQYHCSYLKMRLKLLWRVFFFVKLREPYLNGISKSGVTNRDSAKCVSFVPAVSERSFRGLNLRNGWSRAYRSAQSFCGDLNFHSPPIVYFAVRPSPPMFAQQTHNNY